MQLAADSCCRCSPSHAVAVPAVATSAGCDRLRPNTHRTTHDVLWPQSVCCSAERQCWGWITIHAGHDGGRSGGRAAPREDGHRSGAAGHGAHHAHAARRPARLPGVLRVPPCTNLTAGPDKQHQRCLLVPERVESTLYLLAVACASSASRHQPGRFVAVPLKADSPLSPPLRLVQTHRDPAPLRSLPWRWGWTSTTSAPRRPKRSTPSGAPVTLPVVVVVTMTCG